ncbi:MAG: CopG family transcriptional regulator [Xanthomonadales bacterium]|nr:MAG: CopG family transcriptional regulator [Dokdonella sp.]MBC6942215.1 CopG family transcriptional regulator [Xanthomonadales bacterium]MDL1869309.1 CopG family transcriptional regulator [Gammaproteobacteria bacterium PRO6]
MSRRTVTLSEARYRALKEASAREGKPLAQLVDESLELYGIKALNEARHLVQHARSHARLAAEEALQLAVWATRAQRQ